MTTKKHLVGKSVMKYGEDNFVLEIVERDIKEEDVDDRETHYIKIFNTLAPLGYNLSRGGQLSKSISKGGIESLRKSNLGINNPKSKGWILMIDINTKKVLSKFGSSREAAKYLGKENGYRNILYCLTGKQKTAYGYYWKYENQEDVSTIPFVGEQAYYLHISRNSVPLLTEEIVSANRNIGRNVGEMDPVDLRDTTISAKSRVLQRVTIEDAKATSKLIDDLMGANVAPRKAFIFKHAGEIVVDN